jgi:hypothetical protein
LSSPDFRRAPKSTVHWDLIIDPHKSLLSWVRNIATRELDSGERMPIPSIIFVLRHSLIFFRQYLLKDEGLRGRRRGRVKRDMGTE